MHPLSFFRTLPLSMELQVLPRLLLPQGLPRHEQVGGQPWVGEGLGKLTGHG